jgi:hypothetical protein
VSVIEAGKLIDNDFGRRNSRSFSYCSTSSSLHFYNGRFSRVLCRILIIMDKGKKKPVKPKFYGRVGGLDETRTRDPMRDRHVF